LLLDRGFLGQVRGTPQAIDQDQEKAVMAHPKPVPPVSRQLTARDETGFSRTAS
jgi:hypothetical protein